MKQQVQIDLLSFPHYLKSKNLITFYKWVVLNCCAKEEHPAQLGLKDLKNDFILENLVRHYELRFLQLSEKEEKTLKQRLGDFVSN